MALLTIPSGLVKGTAFTAYLDKTVLFSLPSVSSNVHFSNQANVKTCLVKYVGMVDGALIPETVLLTFDLQQEVPNCTTSISITGCDEFLIHNVLLVDHEGAVLAINVEETPSTVVFQQGQQGQLNSGYYVQITGHTETYSDLLPDTISWTTNAPSDYWVYMEDVNAEYNGAYLITMNAQEGSVDFSYKVNWDKTYRLLLTPPGAWDPTYPNRSIYIRSATTIFHKAALQIQFTWYGYNAANQRNQIWWSTSAYYYPYYLNETFEVWLVFAVSKTPIMRISTNAVNDPVTHGLSAVFDLPGRVGEQKEYETDFWFRLALFKNGVDLEVYSGLV